MRWVIVAIVGIASAGLLAVSVSMNFAFGSSFGRTALESCAYGAAFAFADILKVAAPIVAARSFTNRNWGAALLGMFLWGIFTVCSAVSAIGFASANRTFTVDTRKVQAALNQSRLASLEADQAELRRLRDRLASPEVGRSERVQLLGAVQRLEGAIGDTRGKLEDASPIVSMPNPQAHTLAGLTGTSLDKVETGLVLLVALLVELGGLGPFLTMSLAKVPQGREVAAAEQPSPAAAPAKITPSTAATSPVGQRPRLVFSAGPEDLQGDLRRFLSLHTREEEGSALGSTGMLAHYNSSRAKRGLSAVSQRRFGDAMSSIGHHRKVRRSGGHVHYQGLTWLKLFQEQSIA